MNLERLELRIAMDGGGIAETDIGSGTEQGRGIELQADGKILAGGSAYMGRKSGNDGVLIRHNSDGSPDSSFSGDGILPMGTAADSSTALALQGDQKIVAVGNLAATKSAPQQIAVVRYLSNGSLDTSFDGDGKAYFHFGQGSFALAVGVQADHKIVVAGGAGFNPSAKFGVARFNPDGSLDTSFGGTGKVITDFGIGTSHDAEDILFQSDGKIIVGGGGAGSYFLVARYNPDGSLDTSFDGDGMVATKFNNTTVTIAEMALQPDGKIVATGSRGTVARYNPDGSLDTSFGNSGIVTYPYLNPGQTLGGVGLQSDGKIVFHGIGDWKAGRLYPDGTIDTTFAGSGTIQVLSPSAFGMNLIVQPDDKIVMVGTGADNNKIVTVRLNSDGTFDTTFGGAAAMSASTSKLATSDSGSKTTGRVRTADSGSGLSIDAASIEKLFADRESTWTVKSRVRMRV